jgi:outer membrane protein OmpA-like peptidoglycan-associated protein
MQTFAVKPSRSPGPASSGSVLLATATSVRDHHANPLLHFQREIGNQVVQQSPLADANEPEEEFLDTASTRLTHDFSGIPLHPPERTRIQRKLMVGTPADGFEREAERVADRVMDTRGPHRQHACDCGGRCPECSKERDGDKRLQTKPIQVLEASEDTVPPIVEEVISSPGRPLDSTTREFMDSRLGHDFSTVRLHTDAKAAESARVVNARAYTVGRDVVFGAGQYVADTHEGRRLLAHELTHVVQQGGVGDIARRSPGVGSFGSADEHSAGSAILRRSVISTGEPPEARNVGEGESPGGSYVAAAAPPRAGAIPRPETCPPPGDMRCPPATNTPGAVTNTLIFPVNVATLDATQKAEIDAAAASWHTAGGSVTVRIDGYASAESTCEYNWDLSCRRAQSVASELETPSDGSPGVPNGDLDVFAHGETSEAGSALPPNRMATISIPAAPPTPPAPSPPACTLPVRLGSARGCGSGPDFAHFDFPSISTASEVILAVWAEAHGRGPFRSLVTDTECELEMDGVLVGLAGGAGHAAFSRFAAGTGGTASHGPTSTLGAMALTSGSFLRTVARVQSDIEARLAAQAAGGVLDPCALSVTPPGTSFEFADGAALKAVIGGTQGEELFATGFTGNIPLRSYSIDLRFVLCDDFGVDESDLYAPGLIAFWVLQHERSPTNYIPFINELDLPVTVSGTF